MPTPPPPPPSPSSNPVNPCLKVCVTCTGPAVGVAVGLYDGPRLVASCVTDGSGCCNPGVTGKYTVVVSAGDHTIYTGTIRIPVVGTASIILPVVDFVCCGTYAIPQALTLTDAAGTLALAYQSNLLHPIWYGGHAVTRESCTIRTPGGICISNPPGPGPVRICYQMTCNAGQTPTFAIRRAWSWVYQQGTLTPIWFQDPSGFTRGSTCDTAPPAGCGSPRTDTAQFGADPSSSSPFVLSGTPVAAPSNATSDPVSGSITISA